MPNNLGINKVTPKLAPSCPRTSEGTGWLLGRLPTFYQCHQLSLAQWHICVRWKATICLNNGEYSSMIFDVEDINFHSKMRLKMTSAKWWLFVPVWMYLWFQITMFFFSVQVYFCYQYGMGMNNGDIDIEALEKSLHETLLADSSTRCKQN